VTPGWPRTLIQFAGSDPARSQPVGGEDWLLLLFTATLAIQRPPQDQQRYRRDAAEPYGERDQPKPEEYPGDEGAKDHGDRRYPGV
jgi:hypothetical protein